jgi:hypothetical protein
MLQSVQGLQWTKTTKQAISGTAAAVQTQGGTTDGGSSGTGQLAGTRAVELTSDTDCFVAIGPHGSTTATATTSIYLPAKTPRVYMCDPGQDVSVIGTTGNLYISEGR